MSFELSRRSATIGVLNFRTENHGEDHEKAGDIPMRVTGSVQEMLRLFVPAAGDELVDVLYTSEGHVRVPYLNPLQVNRKPEGLTVRIWDRGPESEPILFEGAKLKGIKMEVADSYTAHVDFQAQVTFSTRGLLERVADVAKEQAEVAISDVQQDMFDPPAEPLEEPTAWQPPPDEDGVPGLDDLEPSHEPAGGEHGPDEGQGYEDEEEPF